MDFHRKIHNFVAWTRVFRKWHRTIGILAVSGLLLFSMTGILLGWKKQMELLPPTQKSRSSGPWLPLDSIQNIALREARVLMGTSEELSIDRMDIRPEQGVMKVTFVDQFWEIQVDGKSGEILSAQKRYSDIIEKIHDGSIFDYFFNRSGQFFKLSYTSLIGGSLLILCISGFSLWLNPKIIRKLKKEEHE